MRSGFFAEHFVHRANVRDWLLGIDCMNLIAHSGNEARRIGDSAQNEIARAMLALAGDEGEPEAIDPAHLSDVLELLIAVRLLGRETS